MDDLITWLRACLDDDERVARQAHAGPWFAERADSVYADESSVVRMTGTMPDWESYVVPPQEEGRDGIEPADAGHIALWNPKRVQTFVAVMRHIIDEHFPVDPCDAHDAALRTMACPTVRWLALLYAARPGYRVEWRP